MGSNNFGPSTPHSCWLLKHLWFSDQDSTTNKTTTFSFLPFCSSSLKSLKYKLLTFQHLVNLYTMKSIKKPKIHIGGFPFHDDLSNVLTLNVSPDTFTSGQNFEDTYFSFSNTSALNFVKYLMPYFKWQADTCWSKFQYGENQIAQQRRAYALLHKGNIVWGRISHNQPVIMATRVKQPIKFSCDFTYRESERDQLEDGLDGEEQREHQVESTEHIGEGQRGTMKLKSHQNSYSTFDQNLLVASLSSSSHKALYINDIRISLVLIGVWFGANKKWRQFIFSFQ